MVKTKYIIEIEHENRAQRHIEEHLKSLCKTNTIANLDFYTKVLGTTDDIITKKQHESILKNELEYKEMQLFGKFATVSMKFCSSEDDIIKFQKLLEEEFKK